MPVTHKMIGTGLTKRPSTHISGPFGEEENAALHRMFKDASQTSTFEGLVAPWEDFCQRVLTQAKLPPWDKFVRIYANGDWADDLPEDWDQRWHELRGPGEGVGDAEYIAELRYGIDSPQWFAARILNSLDLVRRAIARDATATAAHLVWNLVLLIATTSFKFSWEPAAMTGEALQKGRPTGNKNSAQTRGIKKQERQDGLRKKAEAIWKDHPDWNKEKAIREIRKKQSSVPLNTMRRDLSKPEEWSTFKSRKKKT